jgi:hypothetical protein
MQGKQPNNKKMKMSHNGVVNGTIQDPFHKREKFAVTSMTNFKFSALNILARIREGLLSFELLFDRPHSFAVLERQAMPSLHTYCCTSLIVLRRSFYLCTFRYS